MKTFAALASGLLFGIGLILSGMTTPARIVGFLDWFGAWDPTLLFVMGGAVPVYAAAFWITRKRGQPALSSSFDAVESAKIPPQLVCGAALFGIGWGLSGFCPGPSVVALASGAAAPTLFVIAMLAGMAVYQQLFKNDACG
jgi:uncharacterized protein